MANNPNTPYGLQPLTRNDTAKYNASLKRYYVPAAQTVQIFIGDVVTKIAASASPLGVPACTLTTSGSGNAITGVVCGFLGVLPAGSAAAEPSFFPFQASPGQAYRPAVTAYDYYILVCDDPEVLYTVQATNTYNGTAGAAVPVAAVGKNCNIIQQITGLTGTGTSGTSTVTLSAATNVVAGMSIVATSSGVPNPSLGIPLGTTIATLSGTTATLSVPLTASLAATALLINGGNSISGYSGTQADVSSPATTAAYQLNIVGFNYDAANTPGNNFAKLLVRINNNTEVNGAAGI